MMKKLLVVVAVPPEFKLVKKLMEKLGYVITTFFEFLMITHVNIPNCFN